MIIVADYLHFVFDGLHFIAFSIAFSLWLTLCLNVAPQNVYVDVDNGPGCGNLTVPQHECLQAIQALGYSDQSLQVGSWSWAPYGCLVGHPADSWQYAYWNSQNGQTGRDIYRSICYATGIVQWEHVHDLSIANMS